MQHPGSCHCGTVQFEVRADLDDETILDCNCSICRRKGFLHLIVPPERFGLSAGRGALAEYRFETRTALHRFCEICGIHPFYRPRSHPESVDVNVRCLENVDLDDLSVTPFDGANWSDHVDEIRS
ncbi:MAG: GFA family protein [Bradymonadaceae bacterium]